MTTLCKRLKRNKELSPTKKMKINRLLQKKKRRINKGKYTKRE